MRYWPLVSVNFIWLLACAHPAIEFPSYPVDDFSFEDHLRAARDASQLANRTRQRSEKMAIAKKGMYYAARCSELRPQLAPCYFYLALNTGLYYEARVIGYPTGVKRIVVAARKVIALDPSYESGGAYRILGKLYLELPTFSLGAPLVRRDLEKALAYLKSAIAIAPDYPENHLFLAETLAARDELAEANQHLQIAREQMKQKRYSGEDLESWKKIIRQLEKKL